MIHGNTGKVPKTTYPYEVTHGVVQFITKFCRSSSHLQGVAELMVPPVYLPASHNYKTVHDIYVKSVMEKDASQRVMQYQSFVDVWHKCIPEVQFMTPRTDVCAVCEIKLKQLSQRRTRFYLLLNFLIISFKHKQNVKAT